MVHLLAVMLIVSLSLNKANSWEEMVESDFSNTQKSPVLDVKESVSIQIKTDSKVGERTSIGVEFFDDMDDPDYVRYFMIDFGEVIAWSLGPCTDSKFFEFTNLPSEDEKVWTIAYIAVGGPRIIMHCNDVEVLDFLMSDDTCADDDWSEYFVDNPEVAGIVIRGYSNANNDAINGYRKTPQEDKDTAGNEGGDMGHYSHALNCKASGIVLASFLCVLNLII